MEQVTLFSSSILNRDHELVEEALLSGLRSANHLLQVLTQAEQYNHRMSDDGMNAAADAVSMFQQAVSKLSRNGHARIKRCPNKPKGMSLNILKDMYVESLHIQHSSDNAAPSTTSTVMGFAHVACESRPSDDAAHSLSSADMVFAHNVCGLKPVATPSLVMRHEGMDALINYHTHLLTQHLVHAHRPLHTGGAYLWSDGALNPLVNIHNSISCSPLSSARSFLSSVSIDGSPFNNEQSLCESFGQPNEGVTTSLMTNHFAKRNAADRKCGMNGRCHCSKRRKSRARHVIKVPAISGRLADIPADDYSWRKYGQKPIKGSPYPRSYYKCSSLKGCPARKQVERCREEPTMMLVTYEGNHSHSLIVPHGGVSLVAHS